MQRIGSRECHTAALTCKVLCTGCQEWGKVRKEEKVRWGGGREGGEGGRGGGDERRIGGKGVRLRKWEKIFLSLACFLRFDPSTRAHKNGRLK